MRHSLFIYDSDERLVEAIAPFLRGGLAAKRGRAVTVVDGRKWALFADALGPDADETLHVDRDAFYTRPEAALAGYDGMLRRAVRDGARAIRVFGELPRCETDAQSNLWLTYEALLNRAFDHHPVWVICGYDTREVAEPLLDGALDTHPEMLREDWDPSPHYHEPEDVVQSRTPTPEPLAGLQELPVNGDGPRAFRLALSAELEAAAVPEIDAWRMLVAAEEVLANAQEYGGGTPRVQVGRVGDRFVCEVADEGPGIDDPLVGFLPPRPGHREGAGLWVARQLTRQLEVVPSARGARVRLSV
jgi:anti-sigma regulatory factor (Ser/Thr protein kinase)